MSTPGDTMSTLGNVQYTRGYHEYTGGLPWWVWGISWVHWGMFSTLGGYHEYTGGLPWWVWGISWVHWGCSVHWGISWVHWGVFSTLGVIMSTPGGYQDACGGYHEYTGGCSVHQRDTMSTLGGYHEYTGGCSVHHGLDLIIWQTNQYPLFCHFSFFRKFIQEPPEKVGMCTISTVNWNVGQCLQNFCPFQLSQRMKMAGKNRKHVKFYHWSAVTQVHKNFILAVGSVQFTAICFFWIC